MDRNNKILNVKYALINAFYFMLICGALGYANNFLKYKGFSSGIIGITLTLVSVVALIGQTVMAPILDRSSRWNEKKFILATLTAAVATYIIMLVVPDGSWILLPVCVLGFALSSMGAPFLNSLAFAYEQEGGKINYGIGRGIGSAAYAVGGAVIGWLVTWQGGQDEAIVQILPIYLIVTAVVTIIFVLLMKDPIKPVKSEEETKQISYVEFFKRYKKITVVVIAMVLIFFCHMLINTYMINVIQDIGGNTSDQGNAIFLQAMMELPPMFLFAYILKKFKINTLMAVAAVTYVVKHALICFAPNMGVFYLAMVLQMLSYALLIPSSVYFANEHVAPEDRNKGQMVMSATATVGGLLASFFGGILLSVMSVHGVLLVGLAVTAVGAVVMLIGIRILKKV